MPDPRVFRRAPIPQWVWLEARSAASPAKLSVIGCEPQGHGHRADRAGRGAAGLGWWPCSFGYRFRRPRVIVTGLPGSGAPLLASVRVDDKVAVLPWAKGCSADMEVIAVGRLFQITVTSLEVIVPAALVTEADRVSVPVVELE